MPVLNIILACLHSKGKDRMNTLVAEFCLLRQDSDTADALAPVSGSLS
jgi:hypothetical protein